MLLYSVYICVYMINLELLTDAPQTGIHARIKVLCREIVAVYIKSYETYKYSG